MPRYTKIQLSLLIGFLLALSACDRLPLPLDAPPPTPTPIQPTASPAPTGTPQPTATPAVPRGTLTIWHAWTEGERTAWAQIQHGFLQQYPDVLFDVLYVPAQDMAALYEAEARQGRGPAILLGPAELGPSLYAAGLIADLSPVLTQERLDSLNRPALEAGRLDEALIGAPYTIQGVVLYRNKDVVTISPSTWDELVTLAETTTQGEIIGAFLERSFFYSGGHLVGLGGSFLTPDGAPAFNDPTGLQWIELLQQFDRAGPPNFFSDADVERFRAGTVGWIIDGTWNLPVLAAALGPEKLAIDPWPTYEDGQLSGFVMSDNVYLNANTPESTQLAAQAFIDYLLSTPAQTALAEVGRIPAASGVSLADPATGPLLAQAITALAGGATYPLHPAMTNVNLELDVALRGVFENGVPPAQALDQAAAAVQAAGQPAPTATVTP